MNTRSLIITTATTFTLLVGTACGDDGDATETAGSTGMQSTTGTSGGMTESTTDATTTTTGITSDTDPTGDDPFVFDDSPPGDYTQIDRKGMPAVNTAVIMSKDAYNQSSPADDAAGDFVDEIVASVTGLHDALDDDLTGAGLVPCAPADCVAQGAPLVVPDTLKLDLGSPAGFPNGRLPADPVIDVTLAVLLLDLSAEGQTATTLAGLPLNPPANDVDFGTDFPYFAPPH
jgi:hypothetical protein